MQSRGAMYHLIGNAHALLRDLWGRKARDIDTIIFYKHSPSAKDYLKLNRLPFKRGRLKIDATIIINSQSL